MLDKPPDNAVHSIERALAIIETLGRYPQGLGVTELGQAIGLHKSTVHRLLGTLMAYGYVEQDHLTERYRLGMKMVALGLELLDRIDYRREALPFLKELVDTEPTRVARILDELIDFPEDKEEAILELSQAEAG